MSLYIFLSYETNNSNNDESHRLLIIPMGKHKKGETKWKVPKGSRRIIKIVTCLGKFFLCVETFYAYSLQIYTNTLLVYSIHPYNNA